MTEQQHQEREMTILVTGATGTVDSEVVKQLVSSSHWNVIIKAAIHSRNKADNFK
jgi:FlaA1/EpsC-like NDP-sugar epimerase